MKKVLYFVLLFWLVAGTASAQVVYYERWTGNTAYSLNVGGVVNLTPRLFGENVIDSRAKPASTVSIGIDKDKHVNNFFSAGMFGDIFLNFQNVSYTYQNREGFVDPNSPKTQIDARITEFGLSIGPRFGFWPSDNFEIVAHPGLSLTIPFGHKVLSSETRNSSGEVIEDANYELDPVLFCARVFVGATAIYFFTPNFFVQATVRDYFPIKIMETSSGNCLMATLGIGFKVIR